MFEIIRGAEGWRVRTTAEANFGLAWPWRITLTEARRDLAEAEEQLDELERRIESDRERISQLAGTR